MIIKASQLEKGFCIRLGDDPTYRRIKKIKIGLELVKVELEGSIPKAQLVGAHSIAYEDRPGYLRRTK